MALTQVDQGLLGQYAQYTGFKNRIINGAMVIDQRNAGSMVSVTTGETYSVDRFFARFNAGSYSATQGQSTTAPTGFKNSFLVNVTTGGTISASVRGLVSQRVEGYNWADIGYGASGASAVTLSFWVRSSLTGTFSGALQNGAGDRSYVFTYTISSANTWEQKSITIAGDTTGTWLSTNGIGLQLNWDLGNGTDLKTSTTGSWVSGDYRGATGSVAPFANSGSNWYITGVQLEKGSTATSFDYRPYGTELALCQRYLPAWNGGTGDICNGGAYSSSQAWFYYPFIVQPRVAPTGITATIGTAPNTFYVYTGTQSSSPITGLTFSIASLNGARIQISGASGLTAGQYTPLLSNASSGLQLLFTGCEL